HPANAPHWVSTRGEAAIEGRELLMHHGVTADRIDPFVQLFAGRKFAVHEEIGDLHAARILCKLVDRVAAVEKYALFAIDVGDGAFAARRRREAWVIGEHSGLAVELS